MKYQVKYFDRDLPFTIPDGFDVTELHPRECPTVPSETAEVERALAHPMGTKKLSEIVKPGEKIVIVTSDVTRPMPSSIVVPCVVKELEKAGIRDQDMTVVFALGSHRKQTAEERERLVGKDIYQRIRCIDSDPENCIRLGTCKNGTPVDIFRPVYEADRRILLGNVEYHYFAGYSGGMKAIMPGVSSWAAIQANHSNMILPGAHAGKLDGNPVREDIEEVYDFLPVDFILNVALDENHKIAFAAAGDRIQAHRRACEFLDSVYKIKIDSPADIVIVSTSGYPKDINLYQAQKSIDNAKHAVKKGGIMIVAASCREGYGSEPFARWINTYHTPEERVAALRKHFELGGHKSAALALVEMKCTIYLVTDMTDEMVTKANMVPYHDLQKAVDDAIAEKGKNAKIYIIPIGGSTLPMLDE